MSVSRLSRALYRSLNRWTRRPEVKNAIFSFRPIDQAFANPSTAVTGGYFQEPEKTYHTAEDIKQLIRHGYRGLKLEILGQDSIEHRKKFEQESLDVAFECLRILNNFAGEDLKALQKSYERHYNEKNFQYAKYHVGQVVRHRESGFRGVVIGWEVDHNPRRGNKKNNKSSTDPDLNQENTITPIQRLTLVVDEGDASNLRDRGANYSTMKEMLTIAGTHITVQFDTTADDVDLLHTPPTITSNYPHHNERLAYIDNMQIDTYFIAFDPIQQRFIPHPQLAFQYPRDFPIHLYQSFYKPIYATKILHAFPEDQLEPLNEKICHNLILKEEVMLQEKTLSFLEQQCEAIIHHLTNQFPFLDDAFFFSRNERKKDKEKRSGRSMMTEERINEKFIIEDIIGPSFITLRDLHYRSIPQLQLELRRYAMPPDDIFEREMVGHSTTQHYYDYLKLKSKIYDAFNEFIEVSISNERLLMLRYQSLNKLNFRQLLNNSPPPSLTPLPFTDKTSSLIQKISQPPIKYAVGQPVRNIRTGKRGVICHVDQRPAIPLNIHAPSHLPHTPPDIEQPFYGVLICDTPSSRSSSFASLRDTVSPLRDGTIYVAQEELTPIKDIKEIEELKHPKLNRRFLGLDTVYTNRFRLRHYQKYLYPFLHHTFPADYPNTSILTAYQEERGKKISELKEKKNQQTEEEKEEATAAKELEAEELEEELIHAIITTEIGIYEKIDSIALLLFQQYNTFFQSLHQQSLYSPFHSPASIQPPRNAQEIKRMIEESLSSLASNGAVEEKGKKGSKKTKKSTKKEKAVSSLSYADLMRLINSANLMLDSSRTDLVNWIHCTSHPNQEVNTLLRIAMDQRKWKRSDDARDTLTYIVQELDSGCASAYYELSLLDLSESKYHDCIKHVFKVLQYSPLHTTALDVLASAYHELGQYDKAEEYYRLQLEYHPWSSVVGSKLQRCVMEKRDKIRQTHVESIIEDDGDQEK